MQIKSLSPELLLTPTGAPPIICLSARFIFTTVR